MGKEKVEIIDENTLLDESKETSNSIANLPKDNPKEAKKVGKENIRVRFKIDKSVFLHVPGDDGELVEKLCVFSRGDEVSISRANYDLLSKNPTNIELIV